MASDPSIEDTVDARSDDHAASAATFAIGERVGGRYLIRAFLGEGGMGAVYRALDEVLDAEVALKVVRGAVATSEQLRDEVRLAQQVTHPNVCRTYDLEQVGPLHVLKMELVDGETLAARLARDTRLAVVDVVMIGRGIAAGLAAAHARGIVHRDLKPGNVMLARDGRTVLMDFGVALPAGEAQTVAGTPGYMAPEQLEARDIDGRADLYALGCVLYEALAGEPVFPDVRGAALIARHASSPAPDVRVRRPDTPRWLAAAIAELLAKAPVRRQGGRARLLAGPRPRWPYVASGLAVAAIAAVWIAWPARSATPWQPRIVDLPSVEENGDSPVFSPDGTRIAFISNREDETNFRIYTTALDGSDLQVVSPPGLVVNRIAWSRDGLAIYTAAELRLLRLPLDGSPAVALAGGHHPSDCGDGVAHTAVDRTEIRVLGADGVDRVVFTAAPGKTIGPPSCDASGQRLALVEIDGPTQLIRGGALLVVDRDGEVTRIPVETEALDPKFTPDGRGIVFSGFQDNVVHLFEVRLEDGTLHQLTFGPGPDLVPDVSPDGRMVVYDEDTTVSQVVRQRGGAVKNLTARKETLEDIGLAGSTVLVAQRTIASERTIVRIDPETGAETVLAEGDQPFLSVDGHQVYFVDPVARHRLLTVPVNGGDVAVAGELPGPIQIGRAAYDGAHVAILRDGAWASWRVSEGAPEDEHLAGLSVPVRDGGPRFSLDHTRLEIAGRSIDAVGWVARLDDHHIQYLGSDNRLHVLDADTGLETAVTPLTGMVTSVALAPDAETVYTTVIKGHVTRHVIANFGDRPWR